MDDAGAEQWLEIGAPDKAKSIALLTDGLELDRVLEIGCGTGAVLARVIQSGTGKSFFACEPSRVLCDLAQGHEYGAAVSIECALFEESSFFAQHFDLIILTHVLEHTVNPSQLLNYCLERSRYVLVEVPLEGTASGNVRAWIRRVLTRRHRTTNSAGHIQFFSGHDLEHLVRWTGGSVLRKRAYFPLQTYRAMTSQGTPLRRAYCRAWIAAHRVAGDEITTRLYYGHYAVLMTRFRHAGPGGPHPAYWGPGRVT